VKTLHRYLLRQVMASLVMTMLVFTFVLLVGSSLQELLPLIVKGQATFLVVAKAFLLLTPFVFAFALPMAMLTSTILTFERFSGDQELTAARASGISLVSLSTPILLLGLALCGVSAAINMYIAPQCRVAYNSLRNDMRGALANFKLPEGNTYLPGYTIYTLHNRNQNLQDVVVTSFENETNSRIVAAPTGHFFVDVTNQQIVLILTNAIVHLAEGDRSWFTAELPLVITNLNPNAKTNIAITDLTFQQLREEMQRRSISAPIPLSTVTNAAVAEAAKRKKVLQKTLSDFAEPIRIQMHKEVAFSFACFGFTLIGIPLGIRVQRRETKIGVFLALALIAVYFGIQIIGQSLASHPQYAPHLLMWFPNLLFQSVGAVLLWRANRGI
jgi:lipopolysaccharide export system permease protein